MNFIATGSYLPPFVLSNEELSKFVDTSDEWITQRTGIEERRVSEGESTAMLGAKAAQKAIERAGISADEIDIIILATVTPDGMAPTTASYMQGILEITEDQEAIQKLRREIAEGKAEVFVDELKKLGYTNEEILKIVSELTKPSKAISNLEDFIKEEDNVQ